MQQVLLYDTLITRVSNSAAAGQTAVNSAILDMGAGAAGFDGVLFVALLNTVVSGAVLTLTAYENTANGTSGAVAVTNGATTPLTDAGTSSNQVMVVDVVRPKYRYVYVTLTRTAQNVTLDGILAIQYRAKKQPQSQPASVIASALGGIEV